MDKALREEQRREQKKVQAETSERVRIQQTETGPVEPKVESEESGGIRIKDEASREVLRKLIAAQKRTRETVQGLCDSVERIGEDLDTALDLIAETQDGLEKLEGRVYVVEKVLKGHEDRLNEGNIGTRPGKTTDSGSSEVKKETPESFSVPAGFTGFRFLYFVHDEEGRIDWRKPFLSCLIASGYDRHYVPKLYRYEAGKVVREATRDEAARFEF